MTQRLRILELFSGLGGCAAALEPAIEAGVAEVVAALDINPVALTAYANNFAHSALPYNLETLPASRLRDWNADLWWLSPPCQPFTRRGLGEDDRDRRSRPLLALAKRLQEVQPRYVAVENVQGFEVSRCHETWLAALEASGYHFQETLLCPSDLGIPNRRQRYYLLASQEPLSPWPSPKERGRGGAAAPRSRNLRRYLDDETDPTLEVDAEMLHRYRGALHIVEARESGAVTGCFTSAYGRSPVRSGSYLSTPLGARYFSPREILRLLGYPKSYRLPEELSRRQAWRLLGNSLSVPVVRHVLRTLPELSSSLGDP